MTDQQRDEAPRRLDAGWQPAYPCEHCDGGTVWTKAYEKATVCGREHRCDREGCPIYKRVG